MNTDQNRGKSGTPRHFAHLKDKFVTIVAFGDSITEINHHTLGSLNWVGLLAMGLLGRDVFPHGFTIVNSGNSGDDLSKALTRIDRDVLRFNPDIVILSFGMNDCRCATPEQFQERLLVAISRIRDRDACTILLRTPNPMIDLRTGKEVCGIPQDDGTFLKTDLEVYAKVIRDVAVGQNLLCVDHYTLWRESMQSTCVGDMVQLMNDPIHPNAIGHRRFYHELAPVFNAHRNFFHEWERLLRNEGDIA